MTALEYGKTYGGLQISLANGEYEFFIGKEHDAVELLIINCYDIRNSFMKAVNTYSNNWLEGYKSNDPREVKRGTYSTTQL